MKLSEALSKWQNGEVTVIVGSEGLSNNITGAVMLDNPEMVSWMRTGELLLTTGFVLKDNLEFQEKIVDQLIRIKASGLAIKVKRYFEEIPESIIKAARENHLPLLQIPFYMSLSEVSEVINKKIYLSEARDNQNFSLSQSLFDLLQSGGSIKDILDKSERYSDGSLAFLDLDLQIKYASINFDQNITNYINAPGKIDECVNAIEYTGKFFIDNYAVIYPISFEGELLGYLLSEIDFNKSLSENEFVCLKIALAISIAILRERTYFSFKSKQQEQFISLLLDEGALSHSDIIKSANYNNIAIESTYICCVATFTTHNVLSSTNEWVGIRSFNRKKIEAAWKNISNTPIRIVVKNNNIVFLLSLNSDLSSYEQVELVQNFCSVLLNNMVSDEYKSKVFFGIGDPCRSLYNVYRSYSQSLRVVDLSIKTGEESIGNYRKYILYEMVYDSPNASDALKERIKPMLEYDNLHNTALVETLKIYFKCQQNVVAASKQLYIHRNTLQYRLNKVAELLDLDFSDNEQMLTLQLALIVLSFNKESNLDT